VTCYIPSWFTRPSTNGTQCRLTTLIKADALTTTLPRHPKCNSYFLRYRYNKTNRHWHYRSLFDIVSPQFVKYCPPSLASGNISTSDLNTSHYLYNTASTVESNEYNASDVPDSHVVPVKRSEQTQVNECFRDRQVALFLHGLLPQWSSPSYVAYSKSVSVTVQK